MLDYICNDTDITEDKCTWNGVIHKNAECYYEDIRDLEEYICSLKDIVFYYLICHDKQENGIVDKHYHYIVCFSRKTTKSKVRDLFKGSHIELTGNKQASIQYLVHRTVKAKQQNKEQYLYQDIITNDTKAHDKFITLDMQIASKESGSIYQDTGEVYAILTDKALAEDYIMPTSDLIKKYGSKQVKTKLVLIDHLKKESSSNLFESLKEEIDKLTECVVKLQEDNEHLQKQLNQERKLVDADLPW